MSELYERIEKLCKNRNVNITTMCREAGVSRASLSDLKFGRKQNLSVTTLKRIALYFGVSVEILLTGEEKSPAPEGEREIGFDDFTYAMQNEAKELTDEDKEILLSMARQLRAARGKNENR